MQNHKSVSLPSHICGAALGFLGFGISLIIGLYVGNPFVTLVLRATCVLIVFYILGIILASLGHKVVQENFEAEAEELLAEAKAKAEAEAQAKAQAEADAMAQRGAGVDADAPTEPGGVRAAVAGGQAASTGETPAGATQQPQQGGAQNQPEEEIMSVAGPP